MAAGQIRAINPTIDIHSIVLRADLPLYIVESKPSLADSASQMGQCASRREKEVAIDASPTFSIRSRLRPIKPAIRSGQLLAAETHHGIHTLDIPMLSLALSIFCNNIEALLVRILHASTSNLPEHN